jgi:hypothetical protein
VVIAIAVMDFISRLSTTVVSLLSTVAAFIVWSR